MDCEGIKEILYEFLSGEIDKNTGQEAQKHIDQCSQCQSNVEKMRHTIELLKEVEPPSLSPDFRDRLILRVAEKPLPTKPLLKRIGENVLVKWFQDLLHNRMSFKLAAVAAGLLLTLTIIRGFVIESPNDVEKNQRGFQITLAEVKNPITISAGDVNNALRGLKGLIQSHEGKLVQVLETDKGLKITFTLKQEEEKRLFSEFNQLGKVQIEKEGYKDRNGDIVVILKEG